LIEGQVAAVPAAVAIEDAPRPARASAHVDGIPAIAACVDMRIERHRHDRGTDGADYS